MEPLEAKLIDFPEKHSESISYEKLKALKDADLPDILAEILQRIAALEKNNGIINPII